MIVSTNGPVYGQPQPYANANNLTESYALQQNLHSRTLVPMNNYNNPHQNYPTAPGIGQGPPPPALHGEVTCGNCCTSKAHFDAALNDPAFIKRWLNSHLSFMALLCFTSFYVSAFVPGGGSWLFLASILSLIGASIPSCCCPSNLGWKTCILLQSITITMNLVLFFSACFGLGNDDYDKSEKRALGILAICNFFSIFTMSVVIQMARNSFIDQSVRPDMHVQMVSAGSQPVVISNSNVYGPSHSAPVMVMAHAQYNSLPHNHYGGVPGNDSGWVSASSNHSDEQFRGQMYPSQNQNQGHPQGGGFNMYGASNGGFGGSSNGSNNKAHWVDTPPLIVATPVGLSGYNGGGFYAGGGGAGGGGAYPIALGGGGGGVNGNGGGNAFFNRDREGDDGMGGGGGLLRTANEINIQYNSRQNNPAPGNM